MPKKPLQNKEKGRRLIGRLRTKWMDQAQKDVEAKGEDRRQSDLGNMPGIKDDREDSDGEEMDHDSGESDKSSTSCDSSEPPSDSDDSSEMDEEECERRRSECMENLIDLERQFTLLREQLYRERITQVDTKLSEVRSGRAQEYLQPLEQLQENMRIRTEVAGILREFRLTNIRNKFEAEEQASRQNYEVGWRPGIPHYSQVVINTSLVRGEGRSEKSLLWDSIQGELQEKVRRLEEDRNSVDLSADLWLVERSYGKPIRRGKVSEPGRRKPVTVSGPYIVYMLSDSDILEDWTAIKKALSVSKRKSDRECFLSPHMMPSMCAWGSGIPGACVASVGDIVH
uniref:Breast cancer metastasis-suppressor 1-like protein n=1 Tax=Timema bartmani TaxID=61472 RepID=A0A7R9EU07_9NEOP|nr:unnamed protein product [Timema bartmani]